MAAIGGPAKTPEAQTLLPGVAGKCESLVEQGHVLALASNQGGVAMGYLTLDQADAIMRYAATLIGAALYEFCPYHPGGVIEEYRADAWCRKPHPGMLETLQRRSGVPWSEVIFVGNEVSDWQAAIAAGVPFVWSEEFF